MAPMGIRLSPLGTAVFCLLTVGVIYHLYAGVLSSRLAALRRRRTVQLRDLLALSVEAAVTGGREVRRARAGKSNGKNGGGASEKLATGDLSSHRKMYRLIKNAFPYLQVNAEERATGGGGGGEETVIWNHVIPADLQPVGEGREVSADDITVLINPLDGPRQEYAEDLQKYVTTMVCVAVNGVPVIGVIHNPFTEYTVWALVGSGSNLQPRTPYGGRSPRVIVSRSHAGKATRFILTAFGNETVVHTAQGAGYKVLSLLAPPDGRYERADVYLHITYINKRDLCAGDAILRALGGHMTTLKGEEINYRAAAVEEANHDGVLASVGVDHRALLAKLQSADSHRQS